MPARHNRFAFANLDFTRCKLASPTGGDARLLKAGLFLGNIVYAMTYIDNSVRDYRQGFLLCGYRRTLSAEAVSTSLGSTFLSTAKVAHRLAKPKNGSVPSGRMICAKLSNGQLGCASNSRS